MIAVESHEIVTTELADLLRFGVASVSMTRIQGGPEILAGNRFRARQSVLERSDGPRLFPLENIGREQRTGKHRPQNIECRFALVFGRQRPQADRGAIHIDAPRQERPQIGQTVGNRRLVHTIGAKIDHCLCQRGRSGLTQRVMGSTGSKIDLHIKQGQIVIFDEEHTRPGWRHPMLDRHAGLRHRGNQAQRHNGQQFRDFHCSISQ